MNMSSLTYGQLGGLLTMTKSETLALPKEDPVRISQLEIRQERTRHRMKAAANADGWAGVRDPWLGRWGP